MTMMILMMMLIRYYEIEDGNGNTEDDGDDDNDGSVKLMVRRRMKIMTVLTMKNLFLMICWESMIGNQLATVIMRLWQVFHIIYWNLMKSKNNQNHKDWTNFQAYMYISLKLSDENIKVTCNTTSQSFL